MNDITKGIIIGAIGAIICRRFYVKGYNKALKLVKNMADVCEVCQKNDKKEES